MAKSRYARCPSRLPGEANALGERRGVMATIQPKGEKVRQAVKWISEKCKEDEGRSITKLIPEAAGRFNLSPKEEEFLVSFYEESSP
jgi:hypothetical protein